MRFNSNERMKSYSTLIFDAFDTVIHIERERLPEHETEWGFLEFATPIIRDGLDALQAKGLRKVLAVPGMLFAAGHAKNDIPSVLNTYQAQHNGGRHN